MAVGGGGAAVEWDDRATVKEEEGLRDRRARESSCLIAIFEYCIRNFSRFVVEFGE